MKHLQLVIALGLLSAGNACAGDAQVLLEQYRCTICHADYETIGGPAFVDVAVRLKGNPKARAVVVDVVRKGVHGGGPWPMPPSPQVTAADADDIARHILALKPRV
jgi:cytochrome c